MAKPIPPAITGSASPGASKESSGSDAGVWTTIRRLGRASTRFLPHVVPPDAGTAIIRGAIYLPQMKENRELSYPISSSPWGTSKTGNVHRGVKRGSLSLTVWKRATPGEREVDSPGVQPLVGLGHFLAWRPTSLRDPWSWYTQVSALK